MTFVDTSRDIPGVVHGITSLDPPTVRCDGCGYEFSDESLAIAVLTSGIEFNPLVPDDRRRLCRTCAGEAGWS